jgi:hypothetical protein
MRHLMKRSLCRPALLLWSLLLAAWATCLPAQAAPPCWRLIRQAEVARVEPDRHRLVLSQEGLPDMELLVPPEALIYDGGSGERLALQDVWEGEGVEAAFAHGPTGPVAGQVVVYPGPGGPADEQPRICPLPEAAGEKP